MFLFFFGFNFLIKKKKLNFRLGSLYAESLETLWETERAKTKSQSSPTDRRGPGCAHTNIHMRKSTPF